MTTESEISLRVTSRDGEWQPKYLDLISGVFVATYLLANVLGCKVCQIGPLTLNAGLLTFPLCCIFGDILTEIYGFNRTRRIIWLGLFCNLLMSVMVSIAIWLPPAPEWHDQEAFARIFGSVPRIYVASFSAYIFGEFINSYIMSKMKVFSGSTGFGWRAIASTVVAQFVDTIVFCVIAFFSVVNFKTLLWMTFCVWVVKIVYEIVMLPLTTVFVRWLKRLEGVEHFDRQKLAVFEF